MMPSFLTGNSPTLPSGYSADAILDALSREIASATSRRLSRGSNSHRPGGAMRVVKPTSANNSPRSTIQARRRTLMSDIHSTRQTPQAIQHGYLPTPGPDMPSDGWIETAKRASRPLSWHPSSHLVQEQPFASAQAQYSFTNYNDVRSYSNLHHLPPTPAAYSGYTSPSSAFSPLALPSSGFDPSHYFLPQSWDMATGTVSNSPPSPAKYSEPTAHFPSLAPQTTQAESDSSAEWDSFVSNGFNRCIAPPTPDDYPVLKESEPKIPSEDSIPYEPLVEDEPEGEILIGMGLYDPPEKPLTDPTLETYRTSVAHLLGTAYKYPESTGKGLKLEDAWEPPEMEDEEEEDDDDKDADGEAQEDES